VQRSVHGAAGGFDGSAAAAGSDLDDDAVAVEEERPLRVFRTHRGGQRPEARVERGCEGRVHEAKGRLERSLAREVANDGSEGLVGGELREEGAAGAGASRGGRRTRGDEFGQRGRNAR